MINLYIYINNFFFSSVESARQNFRAHSTPVTADRYVVANGHYGRACAKKPGLSHNTTL